MPLWRGDHVAVKQLVEDFARYLYLPRLKNPSVLLEAIQGGVSMLTWEQDSFAFADSFDESAGRYRGVRAAQIVSLADGDAPGLVVKSEVARTQLDAESVPPTAEGQSGGPLNGGATPQPEVGAGRDGAAPPVAAQPKRFHGTVNLDPTRVGRDASRIADEVIAHLSGLVGAKVTVTIEVEAEIPSGAPDHVVRTVTENSRTLKFTSQGFEKE